MGLLDIDLRSLQVLSVLIEQRNVSRTAEKVGLSQPAVSNVLAKLRESLGDPLLVRTRQGMIPTTRAMEVADTARKAIDVLQQGLSADREFHPAESKAHIKVAGTDFAEWLVLPALSKHLAEHAPLMKLELSPLVERLPFKELERGEFDLAIGYFPDAPGSLFQQELFVEDFVCVAHKDMKLPQKLTVERFLAEKHILVAPFGGMSSLIDAILAEKRLSRDVVISTTRFLIAPRIVAETRYLVTLPRRVAKTFSALLPLKIYENPIELPPLSFRQVWHGRMSHEPAHRWLRGEIAKVAKMI